MFWLIKKEFAPASIAPTEAEEDVHKESAPLTWEACVRERGRPPSRVLLKGSLEWWRQPRIDN